MYTHAYLTFTTHVGANIVHMCMLKVQTRLSYVYSTSKLLTCSKNPGANDHLLLQR